MEFDINNFIGKSKQSVFNIAVIIVALIFSLKVYSGEMKKIKKLESNISLETKKNEGLVRLDKIMKGFEIFKNKINGNKSIPALINKIGNIAKGSLVKIASIRPQPEEQLASYVKYSFELSVTAKSFHLLGKFISKLENSPDVYFIERLSIRSGLASQTDAQFEVSADLRLNTILVID